MNKEKRYWECIKNFKMLDCETTHKKGVIYPSEKIGYHEVFMYDSGSEACVHTMDTRERYFTDCFREVESIKLEFVAPEPVRLQRGYHFHLEKSGTLSIKLDKEADDDRIVNEITKVDLENALKLIES